MHHSNTLSSASLSTTAPTTSQQPIKKPTQPSPYTQNDSSTILSHKRTPSTSTIKPGLLVVKVDKAEGLTLPPAFQSNPLIQSYLSKMSSPSTQSMAQGSLLASSATAAASLRRGATPGPNTDNKNFANSLARKRMPIFLVIEFDKTQIVLESTSGPLDAPVWNVTSQFDVSRLETLNMQIYTRIPFISSPTSPTLSSSVSQLDSTNSHPSTGRRYEDIFLGASKISIDPAKVSGASTLFNGAIPLSGGSGKLNLKIDYKPNKNKPLTIDDFELLTVVGKGSFGKVMQVRKKDTNQIYALKTIRKAHIVSRSEVNHTLAERTVLAQIDNPFIVPLKFSFQSPEKLYFVLAFINGGELFHHLQREGKFDLNRSRFYTAELLCALECLHEHDVIYRDLKPENILLDYTGHIALCDFGLCKLNMAGQERTNTFCGTPEYLAPELLLAQGYTKVVDWWTLGVLFYEMLTGLPPFFDENTNDMYRKILQEPLRFPDDMDREARSLLIGLLDRNPETRLGVHGASEIKAHPFFAQIDWHRLMAKKYAAPFKPAVESAADTSNFDQEFTSEVPADSVVDDYLSESVQRQFGGWTYSGDSKLASSSNNRW